MDYKLKYFKYKQKYIALKNNISMFGGYGINSLDYDGIKFIKEDYEVLSKKEHNEFPFFCPDDKPILCSLKTPNYGLCKSNISDCIEYDGENTYSIYDLSNPKRSVELEYGKTFGYSLHDNLNKDCSKLI